MLATDLQQALCVRHMRQLCENAAAELSLQKPLLHGPTCSLLLQVNMIASLSVLELYVLVALFRIKRQGKDSCTFETVTSSHCASLCTIKCWRGPKARAGALLRQC